MKRFTPSLIAALALAVSVFAGTTPAPAHAQEEAPNLVSVAVLSATPAHSEQLADLIGKVAESARMSNLSAKHSWVVYQEGRNFHIVSWPENWASLDDPDAMWREIGAGAGAELMEEAFAAYGELWVTSESHMSNHIEAWSYEPEEGLQAGDHTGAVVFQDWMRPGKGEEFGESTVGIMAMLKEMNFPYPVYGHRVLIGEENLAYFVVLHDGLGDFYGANSMGQLLEASGIGERWSQHMSGRDQLVYRYDNFQAQFRKDLSYMPEGE
jgi:hypothetical protein